MKTTSFRFILAALAATVTLAGCVQEITPPNFENDKVVPAAEGSRVIAVSFTPQTKTTLDGFQPRFEDGKDTVLISNTNALDTCVVSVDDKTGKATISTNLTGPLTAVYPYKAAKMNESNLNQIDTVLVSTEQSGKFADANICMAKMKSENDESLSFENKTAVFCIYPPTDNPEYVEVSAKNSNIANDVPTGSTHTSLETIHVNTTTADSVWVSILVPENLTIGKLTFSDGANEKIVMDAKASELVKVSTLYKVTGDNWESPEADLPEGALPGVFTVADPDGIANSGDETKVHFSQGNLYCTRTGSEGNWEYTFNFDVNQWSYHCIGISDFTYEDSEESTVSEVDFPTTFPGMIYENNTSGLFQWNSTKDDGTADSEDYGAFTTLGSSTIIGSNTNILEFGNVFGGGSIWRTLTISEWDYLINTRKIKGETSYGKTCVFVTLASPAVSGLIVFPDGYAGTTEAAELTTIPEGCVFLPAAGYRGTDYVAGGGIYGSYWSSTASNNVDACSINFYDGEACTVNDMRFYGESVRLITDVSAAPTPTEPDYVEIGGKRWATKNLGADKETDYGDYYAWGATELAYNNLSSSTFTFVDARPFSYGGEGWSSEKGFADENTPYYDGSDLIKYTGPEPDGDGKLELESGDDVATAKLGPGWRMPTSKDFSDLGEACGGFDDYDVSTDPGKDTQVEKGIYWCTNYDGVAGALFCDGTNKLFLPATGYGDETTLNDVGNYGNYWSSTLGYDYYFYAHFLVFGFDGDAYLDRTNRYTGRSVRPVSD